MPPFNGVDSWPTTSGQITAGVRLTALTLPQRLITWISKSFRLLQCRALPSLQCLRHCSESVLTSSTNSLLLIQKVPTLSGSLRLQTLNMSTTEQDNSPYYQRLNDTSVPASLTLRWLFVI